jgi:lipopolysaccharide/colanic/teichoic acid biosynthesis glycosyltransferase
VLKGDLSLVGPRPPRAHEFARFTEFQRQKLAAQQGITCLWQVEGRHRISDYDDWVALDIEYIRNWSLWLDIKILFRTVGVVIKGTGV